MHQSRGSETRTEPELMRCDTVRVNAEPTTELRLGFEADDIWDAVGSLVTGR